MLVASCENEQTMNTLLRPVAGKEALIFLPRPFVVHPPKLGIAEEPSSAEPVVLAETERRRIIAEHKKVLSDVRHLRETGELVGTLRKSDDDSPLSSTASSHRDLHSLSGNTPGLLETYMPDDETSRALQRMRASLASAEGIAVAIGDGGGLSDGPHLSSSQQQFRLSTVFDESNTSDELLFPIGTDQESLDRDSASDQDEGPETPRNGKDSHEMETIDEELNEILGGPAAFWNSSIAERKRWNRRDIGVRGNSGEDVWAISDTVDVSDFDNLVRDPALKFPFELDVFQKRAIYRLECGKNVFVAAHTSAGKTVVAEYAIAQALRHRTRVIYTSPIKALSNQKFRDFSERFGVVGLITGDVSINPEAPLLVMTTEILRSLLYRHADIVRDLEVVVFDEVHWVNDPERGVVWEESIILLPESCGIVMLSATVPNAMEFASWVGRTRQRTVYVESTSQRPVPLVHSIYVKNQLFPVFDTTKRQFMHINFKNAADKEKESSSHSNLRSGGGRHVSWVPLIKYLRKYELDPAIIFCFSKRKCEEAADSLRATDLTSGAADRNRIHLIYQGAIGRLSPADQRVPQIARCRDNLKRGIGVHHAGILPIVKEATEVLFQQGLIRILFCTETFAVGVNAPARTVVFSGIRKWDGSSMRILEPGEYIQMAGRAGRRGKDTVGTVILYTPPAEFPSEIELRSLVTGSAKQMKSQFRLTYNMILNLMRIDEVRIEDVMSRSFSEAPAERDSAKFKRVVASGEKQLEILRNRAVLLDRYRSLHGRLVRLRDLNFAISPSLEEMKLQSKKIFIAGRVLIILCGVSGFSIACIVKPTLARSAKLGIRSQLGPSNTSSKANNFCKVAILHGGPAARHSRSVFLQETGPVSGNGKDMYSVGGLLLELGDISSVMVCSVSSQVIDVNEKELNPIRGSPKLDAISNVAEQLRSVAESLTCQGGLPNLRAREDLGVADPQIIKAWEERNAVLIDLCASLESVHDGASDSDLDQAIRDLDREASLRDRLDRLRIAASDESLHLMPDCRQRLQVLTKLGYIDGTNVLLKGRAMCEVNCCELILVELSFENVLQTMTTASFAALLVALVFQESSDENETSIIDRLKGVADDLHGGALAMMRILTSIGGVQASCGLPVSPVDFARSQAKFGLCEGVYLWACGRPFVDVCEIVPDIAEGSIVRSIVRLSELLREARNVGRIIGDPVLQDKADAAITLIKRDVIFAASLYVT
jgi:antiviral helicase SKI2